MAQPQPPEVVNANPQSWMLTQPFTVPTLSNPQEEVVDGPNDEGEMFERPGRLSDPLPSPYANEQVGCCLRGWMGGAGEGAVASVVLCARAPAMCTAYLCTCVHPATAPLSRV